MFEWDEKSARKRLRDASARFARHEAVVLRLRSEGDTTASEAAALKLRDLKLHLRYSEAVLVAVMARLSQGWRTSATDSASTAANAEEIVHEMIEQSRTMLANL
jgi:hypothetical protein